MAISSPVRAGRVGVTVVTSPACHFCVDAQKVLAEFARTYPLDVHSIDIASEEGRAIVRQYRAPMAPAVLVDGQLLGWGRLSRGKLRRYLDQRLGC
jgi:glutaredoxin